MNAPQTPFLWFAANPSPTLTNASELGIGSLILWVFVIELEFVVVRAGREPATKAGADVLKAGDEGRREKTRASFECQR